MPNGHSGKVQSPKAYHPPRSNPTVQPRSNDHSDTGPSRPEHQWESTRLRTPASFATCRKRRDPRNRPFHVERNEPKPPDLHGGRVTHTSHPKGRYPARVEY